MVRFIIFLYLILFCQTNFSQFSHEIIAHRGAKSLAPENTIPAFSIAIDMKVDFIELDVRKSLDDSLMVMHDSTVNRTTNHSGGLNTFTYAQLKNMDAGSYFSSAYAGEEIPTLYEVLAFARGKSKICIELKSPNIELQTIQLIQNMNLVNQVVIFSFDLNQLQLIKSINPAFKVCYLQSEITLSDVDDLINIGGEYVGSGGSPAISTVLYANYYGIKFWSWTINDTKEMNFLLSQSVDGIITDYPQDLICLNTLLMNSGKIAEWQFDNNSGNIIQDNTGNLNTGIINNANWSNGINGSCLDFNGTSSYVSLPPNNSTDQISEAVSISVWINLNQLPSNMSHPFGPIYDSDQDSYILYLDKANAELRFKVKDLSGDTERPGIPENYLTTGNWHHIVGVYNNEDALIYLDGILIDNHYNPDIDTLISGQIAEIGRNNGSYFNGKIDELKIFNRALLPSEVYMLYNQNSFICQDTSNVIISLDSLNYSISNHLNFCDSGTINITNNSIYNTLLQFNAITDYININSTSAEIAGNSHSFFTWVKTTPSPNSQRIFSINTNKGGNVSLFGIENGKIDIYNSGNNYTGLTDIADGQWHFVGYSWSKTTQILKLYVDGFPDLIFSNIDLTSSCTDFISLSQEFDGWTASNKFYGELMNISIWKTSITNAEQYDIFQNSISNSHPKFNDLVGFYYGVNSCNNQLNDLSSYDNNGFTFPQLNYSYDNSFSFNTINTTHSWQSTNGSIISDSTVLNQTFTSSDQIIYIQSNYSGQLFVDTFNIFINTANPIELGPDTTICIGENFTLYADSSFINYYWNDSSTNSYLEFISNVYGEGIHQIILNAQDQNNCTAVDTLIVTVNDCTFSKEINTDCIKIYPNPSYEKSLVEIKNYTGPINIELFNESGKLLRKFNSYYINTSNIAPGIYLLKVMPLKNQEFTPKYRRLIVN